MLQGAERINLVSVVGWNPLATALQSSRGHHECITRHSSAIIPVRTSRSIKQWVIVMSIWQGGSFGDSFGSRGQCCCLVS
ncbi:hypothetical protein VIGAN_01387500 [Vigna angularis var. angularis]|uniref:Uncharacterized protein n=1 Tax=Vigna angularis var. angularis TaxID=157739 RepID=A0A0S3R607_PHAAN|nr:hypothetical protein VIGAN_01387500 [Vigna angularis var. angularis]